MTVYVPQDDGTKDFSDAARFGEIHVIRRRFIYPDEFVDGRGLPEDIVNLFEDIVYEQYDGDRDYVLPYGDLVQVIHFCSCIVAFGKRLRLLRYDRHERAYMPIDVYEADEILGNCG